MQRIVLKNLLGKTQQMNKNQKITKRNKRKSKKDLEKAFQVMFKDI
jgi:hypothetical protein